MNPPVQLFVPRNRSTTAGPRNSPSPVSNSRRVVGVGAKVLVSWEMPPVTMRMPSVSPVGAEQHPFVLVAVARQDQRAVGPRWGTHLCPGSQDSQEQERDQHNHERRRPMMISANL